MENASKALIIAGSILLSILIIALGMYIFSSSSGAGDTSTLSDLEVSSFNGKFNRYKGQQNGTNVNALLDALISNTRTNSSNSEKPVVVYISQKKSVPAKNSSFKISSTFSEDSNTACYIDPTPLKKLKDKIQSSHRYTVLMGTNSNTDLIHSIVICYGDSTSALTPAKEGDPTSVSAQEVANTLADKSHSDLTK